METTPRTDSIAETPVESSTELPKRRAHVRPPQSTPTQRKALRDRVRAECEKRPGVYRMLGPTGMVLYVGQSRVLRTRLLSYFRAKGRRNKAARILRHAFSIEWEYANTEFGALLRELRLIKAYRPPFNAMMVTDEWPRGYVALTGGAVPGLRIVPRSDDPTAVALFGPFRRVGRLREAVRALADAMQIRDCTLDEAHRVGKSQTLWFADDSRARRADGESTTVRVAQARTQRTRVPGCLRHAVGTCDGPCIGAGDGAAYRERAKTVRAFLEGRSDAPVEWLTREMTLASDSLEFERAGVVRDRLERVSWLHERVQHFHANMDRLTLHYQAVGPDGATWHYLIRRGTVRAEVPAPSNPAEADALTALKARVFSGPDPTGADIPTHDLDEFYLVASWFRRRPTEHANAQSARI